MDQDIFEMIRVCKPNGTILVEDFCKPPILNFYSQIMLWIGRKIGDYPNDIAEIFRKSGFDRSWRQWDGVEYINSIKQRNEDKLQSHSWFRLVSSQKYDLEMENDER